MKVLIVNVMCGIGSTGRICTDIAAELENRGHEVRIAYGRGEVPDRWKQYAFRIGSNTSVMIHALKSRVLDRSGFGSFNATKRFITWIKEYDPDVIHLHNIHGYYINIRLLFDYIRESGKRIIWTLHDCWAFTGHCCYFDYVGCDRWKTECNHCPNGKEYPARLLIDSSNRNYKEKKQLFTSVPNIVLVTPSFWLKSLVKQSYLGEYPVEVIHNGIDTSVFHHSLKNIIISNKKIVLGVASPWHKRKGLDDFIKIASELGNDYQVVLVGLSSSQIKKLPDSIVGLPKTNSAYDLAEYYSNAYAYVNPTYEDNYPTTNIEALACHTPVITYNTGGSPESVADSCVVDKGNYRRIVEILRSGNVELASEEIIQSLDKKEMVKKYLDIYED